MDYSKQSNQRKRIERGFDHQRLVSKVWLNVLRVACISVLAAIFVVAGILLGAFMGIIDDSPLKDDYTIEDFTSYIFDSEGNQLTPIYTSVMRSEVSINDIPQHVQQAVVAIEDSRFYQHNGIDVEGIIRSGVKIFQGGDLQGGSTITQQVIKNLALTSDTAMTRKIQEWYMALQYEYQLTQDIGQIAAKRKILETYLNFVNFGNGNYGVQSASRFYFNKNVDEISIAEAAVLAGVLNAPAYYDPVTEQKDCRERQVTVLQAMRDQGFITERQYEAAVEENVFGLIRENTMSNDDEDDSSTNYTYFQEAAIGQVQDDLMKYLNISEEKAVQMVYHGGLQIHITQDQAIQDIIDYYVDNMTTEFRNVPTYYQVDYALSVYTEAMDDYDNYGLYSLLYRTEDDANWAIETYRAEVLEEYGLTAMDTDRYAENIQITLQPQLSIVLMDHSTGYVKGMSAGRGEKTVDMAYNRATDSLRQPGSTFKVLSAFAPAIDGAGRTAATVYDDTPINPEDTEGWSPHNWWSDKTYFGFSSIRLGISRSMNIVAARCIIDISPELGYKYATENFGITTLEPETAESDGDVTATMALGGLINGVSNLELTTAYASIANGGIYNEASFYSKVYDHDGNLLLDRTPEGEHFQSHVSLSEQSAWIVQDMMVDTVTGRMGWETAKALYLNNGCPIAAKTGTSNDYIDYWITAWSPYYICTIWQGYDMMRYTGDYYSLSYASNSDDRETMWNAIMNDIHDNLEYKDFADMPEGITSAYVCQKSGLYASSGACSGYTEYFIAGTEPTGWCNVHTAGQVCEETGLRPSEDGTCKIKEETKYGVYRDYDLAELEKLLEKVDPGMGFKAEYVPDYVPSASEVCPGGHIVEESSVIETPPEDESQEEDSNTDGQ